MNSELCGEYNREGRICGRCKNRTLALLFTLTLECGKLNLFKYVAVAFLPFYLGAVELKLSLHQVTNARTFSINCYWTNLKCEWTTQTNGQATFRPLLGLLQANQTVTSGPAFESVVVVLLQQSSLQLLLDRNAVWNLEFFKAVFQNRPAGSPVQTDTRTRPRVWERDGGARI